jgi:hypothetical protein
MPNYIASVPAATAVLDADLFEGERWARSPVNRALQGVGVAGSAVVGDTEIEIYIDEVRVGNFFNNALLMPDNNQLMPLESLGIPAGAQLSCIVRDAAATSPINVMVALQDL